MADMEISIVDALDRLAHVLPTHAPGVWETLRPGVTDADLADLCEAVAPLELPDDVVALLRWADGQTEGALWWPALEGGSLLSATRSAQHYKWLLENACPWCPVWLPIMNDGLCQVAVEIACDGPGVVIDAALDGPPRVVAPTLAVMMDVTAEMLGAGIGMPAPDADARVWRAQRDAIVNMRPEWSRWPHKRVIATDIADWPARWQRAMDR